MKLRFRGSSLRLRVNQAEVAALGAGKPVEESVPFPGGKALVYRLIPAVSEFAAALEGSVLSIHVPARLLHDWGHSSELGLYHQDGPLSIAIEKDLECTDQSAEERDPFAYPREKAC